MRINICRCFCFYFCFGWLVGVFFVVVVVLCLFVCQELLGNIQIFTITFQHRELPMHLASSLKQVQLCLHHQFSFQLFIAQGYSKPFLYNSTSKLCIYIHIYMYKNIHTYFTFKSFCFELKKLAGLYANSISMVLLT